MRHHGIAVLSLVALAIVIGCGPSATVTDAPAPSTAAVGPDATASPAASPTPAAEPTPTDPPDSLPPVETIPPSRTPSPAGSCTGDAEQQDFFAAVAEAVTWDVYCPSLPAGWFVQAGSYRLADGGRLQIGYSGPGGASLELSEGAFCADEDGCVPDGSDVGPGQFGDRQGTLVAGADGSFAIVVDRGAHVSWLIVGTGLDRATFEGHAAALSLVPA